jgi:mono/diheme cytochrome c family protein
LPASSILGREATADEVKAWDIDIRPDGKGLPEGKGTVAQGEEVYAEKCASCHGDFGEGVDRWPVLAGGQGTLAADRPVKTIGSYWPYLSTVWDYIHRAMPFGEAQSLEPDEVYAITAYLLNMNDIVDSDFELSKENFTSIKLPNEDELHRGFAPGHASACQWQEPCMENCKEGEVKITGRARILDVTPDGDDENEGGGAID